MPIGDVQRKFVIVIATATITACIKGLPTPRDDFSTMGKDPISEVVRRGRHEKGDPNIGRAVGFSMLDRKKMLSAAREIFLGKSTAEIIEVFGKYGKGCKIDETNLGKRILHCGAQRSWKLINIGSAYDTGNWSTPGASIKFAFVTSNIGEVEDIQLDASDATIYLDKKE